MSNEARFHDPKTGATLKIGRECDGRYIAEYVADDIGVVLTYGKTEAQAWSAAMQTARRLRAGDLG